MGERIPCRNRVLAGKHFLEKGSFNATTPTAEISLATGPFCYPPGTRNHEWRVSGTCWFLADELIHKCNEFFGFDGLTEVSLRRRDLPTTGNEMFEVV